MVIRGAGVIARGIALRLWRAHIQVGMTEISRPTAIRRTVCFSQAVVLGKTKVEDVTARRAEGVEEALALLEQGIAAGKAAEAAGREYHPAANAEFDRLTGGESSRIQLRSIIANAMLARHLTE